MPRGRNIFDKIVDDFFKRGHTPKPSDTIPPHPAFTQEEIDRVFDRTGLSHLKNASLGSNGHHTAWVPVLHAIMDRLNKLEAESNNKKTD